MDTISTELYHPSGYTVSARSEIGSRSSQQDCVLVYGEGTTLFAVLCDGMGGTEHGGMASRRTVSVLRGLISKREIYDMALERPGDFLHLALESSDSTVSGDVGLQGSGTTLTMLLLNGRQAYWASVGDSRLYILRGKEMVQATRDHNYRLCLDELKAQGRIGQQRYVEELVRGRALVSYIGMGGLQLFDLTQHPMPIYPGDIFLLTSDGLTGLLSDAEIQSVLESDDSLEQRGDRLAKMALVRGQSRSMDNTTFVLIQTM